jgi:3-oxoacyl-[acyl-carrier-protein] synthase-3
MGVWLPDAVRRNDAWPQSFVDEGHKRGERILNDVSLSDDPVSAALMAPYQEQERDPFLAAVERRVAGPSDTAAAAEVAAANAALADAGIPACDITHVLTSSVIPDHLGAVPCGAVTHGIGTVNAQGIIMDTACASAVTGLELASALVHADPSACVLLTQSHLFLRAMPLLHPACPGVGDVATAFVVSARASGGLVVRSAFGATHGEFHRSVLWRRGMGPDADPPWFEAGGPYRLSSYDPAGVKYLQRETISFGARTVEEAARRANVAPGFIDVLCSVQPRKYIPGCIAERLGLPRDAAVETYEEIAHVGLCGPIYNLWTARERGMLHPGTTVALYGQGAGFTRAAAILEVSR